MGPAPLPEPRLPCRSRFVPRPYGVNRRGLRGWGRGAAVDAFTRRLGPPRRSGPRLPSLPLPPSAVAGAAPIQELSQGRARPRGVTVGAWRVRGASLCGVSSLHDTTRELGEHLCRSLFALGGALCRNRRPVAGAGLGEAGLACSSSTGSLRGVSAGYPLWFQPAASPRASWAQQSMVVRTPALAGSGWELAQPRLGRGLLGVIDLRDGGLAWSADLFCWTLCVQLGGVLTVGPASPLAPHGRGPSLGSPLWGA